MFKKILALVMCVVMMCGMGVVANAQGVSLADENTVTVSESGENQIQPRYDYTNIISCSLTESGGKAQCFGNVGGYNGTTTKIVLKMILQKRTMFWWSTVQEWSTTANTYYATLSKTASVDSGKTYRVKLEATVYSGSNSEEITMYSQTYDF